MNYIIFDFWGNSLPIAKRLQDEGNKVLVGKIGDVSKTFLPGEPVKSEDSEMKKRRLSQYEGIMKIIPADVLIRNMKYIKNPQDYFVFPEGNWCFWYTEKAEKMGFGGLLPTTEDRKLEVERDIAKDIVKKYYPDVKVGEYKQFKTAKEGIDFLKEQKDNSYVLKSLGEGGETVVPKNEDAEINNEQIINILQEDGKEYEKGGYILEQKIMDGVEVTPQMVFYDGDMVFTDIDIETKTLGAGEKGPNVGCGTNLIVRTNFNDKINKIAFPKYIRDEGKKRSRGGKMYVIDLAIIFDKKADTPYFLEYCSNRVGWDSFVTETAMAGDPDGNEIASPFFENLVAGENPLGFLYGASARIFNLNQDEKKLPEEGLSITVSEEAEPDAYLYDVKKSEDLIVTAGYMQDMGAATGVENTLEKAVEKCYNYAAGISFKDSFYRPQDDFLSVSYPQAIMNRYNYIIDQKLIIL